MTDREVMKLALEALDRSMEAGVTGIKVDQAITVLRQALSLSDQQPAAWPHKWGCRANAFGKCDKGCTEPPKREWVGLTEEDLATAIDTIPFDINNVFYFDDFEKFGRVVEAKLKEKNTCSQ